MPVVHRDNRKNVKYWSQLISIKTTLNNYNLNNIGQIQLVAVYKRASILQQSLNRLHYRQAVLLRRYKDVINTSPQTEFYWKYISPRVTISPISVSLQQLNLRFVRRPFFSTLKHDVNLVKFVQKFIV